MDLLPSSQYKYMSYTDMNLLFTSAWLRCLSYQKIIQNNHCQAVMVQKGGGDLVLDLPINPVGFESVKNFDGCIDLRSPWGTKIHQVEFPQLGLCWLKWPISKWPLIRQKMTIVNANLQSLDLIYPVFYTLMSLECENLINPIENQWFYTQKCYF